MESAAKRKASSGAGPETDGRPPKRQKATSDADSSAETPETTTTNGLKFLDSLRAAKDKTGRPIAVHFIKLPSKDEIPEYYDIIKLPISIETMEARLKKGEYATLAQLESDCKRLVNNAKVFNDKKSIIYEDAERLRKTASNWMVKNNPAYRTQGYTAIATPVPGEEAVPPGKPIPRPTATSTPKPKAKAPTPEVTGERSSRRTAVPPPTTPAPSKLRHSASAVPEQGGDSQEVDGNSFQQAQDQIIKDLIEYVEESSGLQIFQPFVNLPSRSLKDYYAVIKHPMSLSAVQKRVRGVVGRNPGTGITDLKSWNAFEEEVSLIWKNARDYNEDGSPLYDLSVEFEDLFREKLEEVKSRVAEPPQPKLKLNMSAAPKPQLKLKLRQSPSSEANTPTARSSATPDVIVHNESLLRQQRHVLEGINGTRPGRPSSAGKPQTPAAANPFGGSRGASASIPPLAAPFSKAAGSPPATNGIKTDVQSPALNSIRPASTASDGQRLSMPAQTPHPVMPPPMTTSRPTSGSPHPNGPIPQQTTYTPQYHPSAYHVPPPVTPHHLEHIRGTPLSSIDEALIPKISLCVYPNLSKPFMVIPANKQKSVQSVTINLPPSRSHLGIIPTIPVAHTSRPWRIFYSINTRLNSESPRPVTSGVNGAGYEGGRKKGEPFFEAKLGPGVTRLDFEVIAEKDRKGKPESRDPKEQVEIEKCTIFVNVMKY